MKSFFPKSWRILSVVAFTILATFCGVGITWVLVAILANSLFKSHSDQFVAGSEPMLMAGGILGFVAGLVSAIRVAKADPETERKIEEKYVGARGRAQIFFGAPMSVFFLLCAACFDPLIRSFDATAAAYTCLGIFTACVLSGLYLYERLPKRFIMPIGVIGWLLVVLMALVFAVYTDRQPM